MKGVNASSSAAASALRRLAGRDPWPAVLPVAALLVAYTAPSINPYRYSPDVVWHAASFAMVVSLAWRRRRPLLIWASSTATASVLLATVADPSAYSGIPLVDTARFGGPLLLAAPLLALYTLTGTVSRRNGLLALGMSVLALAPPASGHLRQSLFVTLGMIVTAWALGERAKARRQATAAHADRAAAVEAERAERDRAAAADERARIAAEIHDVVAHHISVVALQAGAARLLAQRGQPADSRLLEGIEAASRQALSEIRQALGVIRSTPDGPAPLPGLARLPGLIGRIEDAGVNVTVTGAAGHLPASLDLTAYRVVQEGLTNVLRHSAAGAAAVTLCRTADILEVTVTDHGPARPAALVPAGGHGIAGLRQRLAVAGGDLEAGPLPSGGFQLRAWLPAGPARVPAGVIG